ncbi:MAG TPA: hypothetical protein VGO93_00560, partial [Candidatus Xenobia bacterium]
MRARPEDFDSAITARVLLVDRLGKRLRGVQAELVALELARQASAWLAPAPPAEPPAVVNTGTPAVEVDVMVIHHRDGTFEPIAVFKQGSLTGAHLLTDEGEAGQTWEATLPTGERC